MAKQVAALLGLQWGDEGKGKLIDKLAEQANLVVRYQGGHNAGHTVIHQGKKIILHLLPSGLLNLDTCCVIAHGVVLSLDALEEEMSILGDKEALLSRLVISDNCPLLLPSHIVLDRAAEKKREDAIGTTGRGIGPAYEDHTARRSLQLKDVLNGGFVDRLSSLLDYHNFILKHYYDSTSWFDIQSVAGRLEEQVESLRSVIKDTISFLHQNKGEGKRILLEGAQGCRLDLNQGTYPFVTSSNTSIGGVFVGSGLSPKDIDMVIGVTKAYATRVGGGPFPTELDDDKGQQLQQTGGEFGATTGRPRRCGWLDLVDLRRTVQMNGVDTLLVTKLDVLNDFANIPLCVDYNNGIPCYREVSGWQTQLDYHQPLDKQPAALRAFIDFIEDYVKVPVAGLSVGARRQEWIVANEIW